MKMTNPNPSPIGLGFGFILFGADVHKGFNKHTGTYSHISKNAHFAIVLFCGTMHLQRRFLRMKEQKRILEITDFQLRLFINC